MQQSAWARRPQALAELLPWLSLLGDALVVCKDGSLLACFAITGLEADAVDPDQSARAAERIEQAIRGLDERHTVWSLFQRRRVHAYQAGQFPHPVTAFIDQLHGQRFLHGQQFSNSHTLAVLFTPTTGEQRWKAALSLLRSGRWLQLPSLLLRQIQRVHGFAGQQAFLASQARGFEAQLEGFAGTLAALRLQRLQGESLLGFLDQCASPTRSVGKVRNPAPALLLDAALGQDQLAVGAERLHFRGASGERWMAALGIKAWPDHTLPGVIEGLLHLPGELCIAQVFRVVAPAAAKAHIQSVQRFHLNLQRSAFSFLREAVFGEPGRVQDDTRGIAAEEARQALADLGQHRQVYGYYNLSVLVLAESCDALEPLVREAAVTVRAAGFLVLREHLHLLSAWTGALPGQWGQLVRWHFIHSGNLADLLPLSSPGSGAADNPCFSEQLGQPCAALATLPGADATSFQFNFHCGDLGHAFVVGPSRSGKSVLMNFLMAQFLRYPAARVLIFDKDRSCRIATVLQGGTHLDPASPDSLRCNPLAALASPSGRRWLQGWLEELLCLRSHVWTSADDLSLNEALDALCLLPVAQHRLGTLQALLPPLLATELAPWVGDGRHAWLFDHGEDTFAATGLCCIEMGELLRDEALARLFMRYAFQRVDTLLEASVRAPTLIYIEEAWFMLDQPAFRERIRDWLKTLPKRLASVVLATQSLEDLVASPVFSTIADNIPTRIFLPNRNAPAQSALYRDQFGLNAAQILRVARAEPKRQFLVTSPEGCRFIDLVLPVPVVNLLRSDRRAQACFDACLALPAGQRAQHYLREMARE